MFVEGVPNNCEGHSHSVRIPGVGTLKHMSFNFVQMHDGPNTVFHRKVVRLSKFESHIKACQIRFLALC